MRKAEQDKTDAPFLQEYPETIEGCFLTAGGSYFASPDNINHLEQYRNSARKPIEIRDHLLFRGNNVSFFGPNLHIWQLPQPGQPYVMWVDNAGGGMGAASDFSAIMVMNVAGSPHLAARVNIKVAPEELAPLVCALGAFYNNALVGGERDHYGESCLRRIQEIGYNNLWYFIDPNKGMSMHTIADPWAHPNQTRDDILSTFRAHVIAHTVDIGDPLTIQQMGSFTWQKVAMRRGVKAKAEGNKKDDLVIVAAGCTYIAREGRAKYNAQVRAGNQETVVVGKHGLVISRERPKSYNQAPWLR